jgi:hypothetical protein
VSSRAGYRRDWYIQNVGLGSQPRRVCGPKRSARRHSSKQVFDLLEARFVFVRVRCGGVVCLDLHGVAKLFDELLLLFRELLRNFDDDAHVECTSAAAADARHALAAEADDGAARRAGGDIDGKRSSRSFDLNDPPIAIIGYGTATST